MNRRGFLQRTIGAMAAAIARPYLLVPMARTFTTPPVLFPEICFKNIPLRFDRDCPVHNVYFLGKDGPYVIRGSMGEIHAHNLSREPWPQE
jgi:hypothetical protein